MITQLIKKELLMFWRRPRELVVLLLMPFILITILGAALGAINDGESPNLNIKLAIIQKDDPNLGMEKMVQKLESLSMMPETEKKAAIEAMASFQPIRILLEEVLGAGELKGLIEVVHVENAPTDKEAKQYSGILEIPSQFTEQFFTNAFFEGDETPELNLSLNDSTSLAGSILKDFFTNFSEELSFWTVTHSLGINPEELSAKLATEIGETRTVSEKKTINSVSYYAIGMSVMFMFYVAGNAAAQAFEEKQQQIFGRVLLANVPIPIYFTGILVATALVSLIQINILFGLSALIHGVIWPSILNYFVVTGLLSIMVGAFAAFIAAVSYRIHSGGAIQVFSSFLIPIIAFVGGSFVPVTQLGGLFEDISKYSPGGAGISAYYKIMQGYHLADISTQVMSILVTVFVLIAAAFFIMPKRGETL